MKEKRYSCIVIERLEYYLTKEIEKSMYGQGEKFYTSLYERLNECINARRELGFEPIPKGVKEFLQDYGYDDKFVSEFISKAQDHSHDECPGC
jgi:hypothetical protein